MKKLLLPYIASKIENKKSLFWNTTPTKNYPLLRGRCVPWDAAD